MNYRRDSKPKKRTLLTLVGIFFAVYLIFGTGIGTSLYSLVERISSPLWNINSKGNVSARIAQWFSGPSELIEENAELKRNMENMSLKLLDRNLLYEENVFLKEQIGRSLPEESILARVLAKPGRSPYDTLVLDIGARSGLRGGEEVLYGDNILIGIIVDVGDVTSKVKLFSSAGEKFSVEIGPHSIPAEATGRGAGNFEAQLPRDAKVAVGDSVVAPALMPHVMGAIEHIELTQNDPWKRVLWKSPISPLDIDYVVVLLNI